MKKTLLFLFVLLNFSANIFAQDLIYTVRGVNNNNSLGLDSILVENLDNGTSILFGSLPEQPDYVINLSTGQQQGPSGINAPEMDQLLYQRYNSPGRLGISVLSNRLSDVNIAVFNIQGQLLWFRESIFLNNSGLIDLKLPGSKLYLVEVSTSMGKKTFRAIGSDDENLIQLSLSGGRTSDNSSRKGASISAADDFSFEPGDNLRVAAFANTFYARPKEIEASVSQKLLFQFDQSAVTEAGISDGYVPVADSNFTSIEVDLTTGQVELVPLNESDSLYVGDVLTIDMDTVGYLRKVVDQEMIDGKIVLQTEQATMSDIFVDKSFKLSTVAMDPNTALKSTSSPAEIAEALTDEQGYIHPVEIIFFDQNGQVKNRTSLLLKSAAEEIRKSIIDAEIDFPMTDLYGKQGDNIHFYVSEGNLTFKTDAVFEFEFDHQGEITEDTKLKKGDLKAFMFYLEATAGVLTKVALDMQWSEDREDRPEKPLFPIFSARAKFVVPPGIPVWIDFDANMYRAMIFHADASLHADWGFEIKDTLRVGGHYTRATKELAPINEFKHHDTIFPLNLEGEINASARLELYPRVDMKLYSIFGPFAEVVPYVQGYYNGAFQTQITPGGTESFLAYNAGIDLGLDLRVGTELDIIAYEKEFGPLEINCFEFPVWIAPDNIELLTDLPADPAPGSTITLEYKVTDNLGFPLNNAVVYLEGDGELSSYMVFTNLLGVFSVDWTIGSSAGTYSVEASLYNADKSIAGSASASVEVSGTDPDPDPDPDPVDGLIAYYPFDGNSDDMSGNDHLGELIGPVPTADRLGTPNSAYYFDGVDDYINIGNTIKPSFPFSICLWVNPDDVSLCDLIRTDRVGGDTDYYYGAMIRLMEGRVYARVGNGYAMPSSRRGVVTDENVIGTGSWQFISCVFTGINEMLVYVNGDLKPGTFDGTASSISHSTSNGAIGNQYINRLNFGGSMDEVMVFDRSLTEQEITNLYNEQKK